MTQRFCYALDLKDDPRLIAEYEAWHQKVWPEVLADILASGITNMEIYRTGNRLSMIVETDGSFDTASRQNPSGRHPRIEEWENLMGEFQQSLPHAKPNEKWVQMKQIFSLL